MQMRKLTMMLIVALALLPALALCEDFGPAPYEIWWETVYGQIYGVGGNPIGCAQILIDGNKQIIAQGDAYVHLYGDEQVNGTAWIKSTPVMTSDNDLGVFYPTKGVTKLGDYLISMSGDNKFSWTNSWDVPWTGNQAPGRVDSDSY